MNSIYSDYICSSGIKMTKDSFKSIVDDLLKGMSQNKKVFCPRCETEGKRSKVILYPGQTVPKMKFTDGYWNENGDFVEFNAEIKLPWYICSNGHATPRNVADR
ncbi:MAG: hypothetical protein ACRD8Z_10560 [Nitrososphaeraceae archaeon]